MFLKMYQKMFITPDFVEAVEISKIRIGSDNSNLHNIFNLVEIVYG